jgi:hypothetical protein
MKFNILAIGLALLIELSSASAQQFALVPAQPQAFDPVVLRMTVDSCVFDQDRVGVTASQGTFRVNLGVNNCLVPGPTKVIDVRLGTLPIGTYRVDVSLAQGDIVQPNVARIDFSVTGRPTIAIFPPPKKPNTDFSGNWFVPAEPGWGLAIQQSPTDVVFAELFVYGANGSPTWFTLQDGQWKSATRWEGRLFANTGPAFSDPVFDPGRVTIAPLGTASIEFEQAPGTEGLATLTYNVNNIAVTKRIRRLAF